MTNRQPQRAFWPALVAAVVFAGHSARAQTSGPTLDLFDGRSLEGWEGDLHYWRVENGLIIGEIPPGSHLGKNTWLVWRAGEVADFELRLQVRMSGAAAANSGIQFRCQVDDVDHVAGYQADLDLGTTWLGRIYDEHGRALLVERGSRVAIAEDGSRRVETFAPAEQYTVLFRENDWNDYRIVADGQHIQVFVNGTLFSELLDQQTGQFDAKGSLALQLHSGPETKVEFRAIQLEHLSADDERLGSFVLRTTEAVAEDPGAFPQDAAQRELNLSFETGTLAGWTATGDAFTGQPVRQDGIAQRWPGQTSNKQGEFFIGGFEIVQDRGQGTLTSPPFTVTAPFASFLIGGGQPNSTRVELVQAAGGDAAEQVVFTASGKNREQMDRVAVDLRKLQGRRVFLRLVDESSGGWGHLNFDDFRFHAQEPRFAAASDVRTIANPLLQHLRPNPLHSGGKQPGEATVAQMFLPPGFSAQVVAAEPRLHQPVAFTFDAKGRLWVVEAHSYPQKRPEGEGLDRILIFSDNDTDGSFETSQVFLEGLNLVSALEVGFGGVWVGAAPELLFIPDHDGDGQPDPPPQVLLDGFGFADTHETLNSFLWGPDGWLYGNQGVFNTSMVGKPGTAENQRTMLNAGVWRYHPTRHEFEVFASGGSNQWGLDYDDFGQFFMTHCRSYWGRGPTTHVMQGGHYWNQVNGGYAPFISATAPAKLPWMRSFLLASARYGHGEGGAGKPGSQAVYGGHSHVGTMIYLGDNWPSEFRNHLFTHNLHGRQINHQINRREAGGFNTVHAGSDVLFCADPQFIGVDLTYGPDGAVYISDWYDPRNCHNPNVEQWDRGNGRIYRVQYEATYRPVSADLAGYTDAQLVQAQLHANDWFVRTARRLLAERHHQGVLHRNVAGELRSIAVTHPEAARRLRAVWCLHGIEALDAPLVQKLLRDESEYIRAWAIQLGLESAGQTAMSQPLKDVAGSDPSLLVRRYLASAIPRVSPDLGWPIAKALSQQAENSADRDLPLLIWFGVAQLMQHDATKAWQLAEHTRIDVLRDYVYWYSAKLSDEGRNAAIEQLLQARDPDRQLRLLSLFELGIGGMRGLSQPRGWSHVAGDLYASRDVSIRHAAESLGAAFGDEELFARMRNVLHGPRDDVRQLHHALSLLAYDSSPRNLPLLLKLLDSAELRPAVIPLLNRFDDPQVGSTLVGGLPKWEQSQTAAAMDVLAGRVSWSKQLLDAIAAGTVSKDTLTAYHVRMMSNLGDKTLNDRLAEDWGALSQTSAERKAEIEKLAATYQAAPLWAYNSGEGRNHYNKLCASCHQAQEQTAAVAPSLAGTGSKGIVYIVENIIDPNAVIGRDFQARIVVTTDGRVINGLVEQETGSAIQIRTATNSVTVAKDEIEAISISPDSFMPEGLLKDLNEREQIELLKFLMTM
jgi:putative membrane-bound dehydrogenase-like protein